MPTRYEIERQWSGRYIDHPRNPATIEISLTCAGNLREKAHSVLRGWHLQLLLTKEFLEKSQIWILILLFMNDNNVCHNQNWCISSLLQQPHPAWGPYQTWLPQQTIFRTMELRGLNVLKTLLIIKPYIEILRSLSSTSWMTRDNTLIFEYPLEEDSLESYTGTQE